MCSEIPEQEDAELGSVTKFGEHAVRKNSMPISIKSKDTLQVEGKNSIFYQKDKA